MKEYKWSLRKGGKKDRCPQCGKMRFVPYVLSSDPTVKAGPEYGRCDREQSCGYFRYPGGEVKVDSEREYVPEPPKEPILIPFEELNFNFIGNSFFGNSLYKAYKSVSEHMYSTFAEYMIFAGVHGECIYPQFDGTFYRTAKAILYGKDGHRLKTEDGGLPVWWLHKSPALRQYTAGKELRQCFFGQHLLGQYPEAKVYVVEAEKTAVMMAATDKVGKGRLWIACGGSQMLKGAIDLSPLIGRDVTLVPDDGQYWNWKRTADAYGWDIVDIEPMKRYHNLPDGCDIWDCREAAMRKEAAR